MDYAITVGHGRGGVGRGAGGAWFCGVIGAAPREIQAQGGGGRVIFLCCGRADNPLRGNQV